MRALALALFLAAHPPLADQWVDVGDHRLRARIVGAGRPTVVLESALGDGLEVWDDVQVAVGSFARVMAYDRAGLAGSEEGPLPRTPKRIAKELHALLEALEMEPPYVLVGHSVGGFHIRAFAALYPAEVAGFVLVDATHEKVDLRLRGLDSELWEAEREATERYYAESPGANAEWVAVRTIVDEGVLSGMEGLPDIPTVILTSTRADNDAESLVRTPQGVEIWVDLHRAWAESLSDVAHVLTDKSGHYIQMESPGLVIAAIREACRASQENRTLSALRLQRTALDAPAASEQR